MKCRYWHQRFKIWEQYDKGIWMTEDAWFGVTPEPIAKYVLHPFQLYLSLYEQARLQRISLNRHQKTRLSLLTPLPALVEMQLH
jgi:hypothetical protein